MTEAAKKYSETELLEKALARERSARKLAEKELEDKSREVYFAHSKVMEKFEALQARNAEIEFLNAVSQLAIGDVGTDEALNCFVREVCRLCGWPLGHAYLLVGKDSYVSSNQWFFGSDESYESFVKKTEEMTVTPGVGLVGMALQSEESVWVKEITDELDSPRIEILASLGIKSGFALPIRVGQRIGVVTEFFAAELHDENLRIVEAVKSGALLLGMVLERNRRAQELQQNYAQLRETHKELVETQGQLVQSEKMASLGTIAAGVAHEVNNPIGFILSNISTLSEYTEDLKKILELYSSLESAGDQKKVLEEIKDAKAEMKLDFILKDVDGLIKDSIDGANRVKEIVQGLKTFSRVDDAELVEADLNECIETTLKVVWNELKYKCEVSKLFGKLPMVRCFPQSLNQVFMNLFVNAAHAIDKRGEIKIRTQEVEEEIRIDVCDNGKGIPKENIDKLFNPFFTTKEVGQGTGLGLSVSHGIIEKHGGRIEVTSEVGKGTCFTIWLPTKGVANEA